MAYYELPSIDPKSWDLEALRRQRDAMLAVELNVRNYLKLNFDCPFQVAGPLDAYLLSARCLLQAPQGPITRGLLELADTTLQNLISAKFEWIDGFDSERIDLMTRAQSCPRTKALLEWTEQEEAKNFFHNEGRFCEFCQHSSHLISTCRAYKRWCKENHQLPPIQQTIEQPATQQPVQSHQPFSVDSSTLERTLAPLIAKLFENFIYRPVDVIPTALLQSILPPPADAIPASACPAPSLSILPLPTDAIPVPKLSTVDALPTSTPTAPKAQHIDTTAPDRATDGSSSVTNSPSSPVLCNTIPRTSNTTDSTKSSIQSTIQSKIDHCLGEAKSTDAHTSFLDSLEERINSDDFDPLDIDDDFMSAHKQKFTGLTISRRSTRTRLPRSEAEMNAPLRVVSVNRTNLDVIMSFMNDKTVTRFRYLWQLLEDALRLFLSEKPTIDSIRACALSHADATMLFENGLSRKISPTAVPNCIPFTVVQQKNYSLYRRFILWAEWLNDTIKKVLKYEPDVPLPHISKVLHHCHAPFGGTLDGTTSFHQVGMPEHLQQLLIFADDEGHKYCFDRLPMGLCISPEIMQIISATLAGHIDYCKPPIAAPEVATIWIDNIQICGSQDRVQQVISDIRHRAAQANYTFNDDAALSHEYVNLGVRFNHLRHTVSLADKNVSKLKGLSNEPTIGDLESHIGRLWFASAVLGISIQPYYWFLKILRRRLSLVNNSKMSIDDKADLSAAAISQLRAWTSIASINEPRSPPLPSTAPSTFTLFVDATLVGWGAVLINNATVQVYVAGSRWRYQPANINSSETKGVVAALHVFDDHIKDAIVDVNIDNTSALAGVKRGYSKTFSVNDALRNLHSSARELRYAYVQSAKNLADKPSRVLPILPTSVPGQLVRSDLGGQAR